MPVRRPSESSPWQFVSDLYGRVRAVPLIKRGRRPTGCVRAYDDEAFDEETGVDDGDSRELLLQEIWAKVLDVYAGYVQSGLLTAAELRTVHALLINGLSLREFARREGVKPAAISTRIEGLQHKAPEFYTWWCRKHQNRRHRKEGSGHAR
jgi:hypothetical protein